MCCGLRSIALYIRSRRRRRLKYVEIDEHTGEVRWDQYFEYLRTIEQQFPPGLYSYASKWEHYSLDGRDSLHDAWLFGIHLSHRAKELVLEFLGSRHDRKLILRYSGLAAYRVNLDVTFRDGDRDVLAHEFRIEDALVCHEIAFQQGRSILVTSQSVMPTVQSLV